MGNRRPVLGGAIIAISILAAVSPSPAEESQGREMLDPAEFSSVGALMRAARYQVSWQVYGDVWAYRADNDAQGFAVASAYDGLHLDGVGWRLDITPQAYGGRPLPKSVDSSQLQGFRDEVEYRWGQSVIEKWANGPEGLRHEITLSAPTSGIDWDPSLEIRLGGAQEVWKDGLVAFVSTGEGQTVLSYRIIAVSDAQERAVDVRLRCSGDDNLLVEFETDDAIHPITIKAVLSNAVAIVHASNADAIVHASDMQTDDYFGHAVAIDGNTVVIGAYAEDGGAGDPTSNAGAVYIFERDQGGENAWGEARIIRASDAQADDGFGLYLAIHSDTLVVGAYKEDGGPGDPVEDTGAVYVFERNLGGEDAWGEVTILHASDAQANDFFGSTMSIHNDTLVVGAKWEDGGPGDPLTLAGAAYVFDRNEGGADAWGEVTVLRSSEIQAHDIFGVSVSVFADTIVVGAYAEDGGAGDPIQKAGAAYVFERNEGGENAWGEVKILRASDAQAGDYFGVSTSLEGDTVVVGAYWEDGGAGDPSPNAGSAYIFGRNSGGADAWGEVQMLRASDAQADDLFGISVSINGDTVVAGAVEEDGGQGSLLPESGAAYLFDRNQGGANAWGELRVLRASDAWTGDRFGVSVAIDNNTTVVGAFWEDGGPGDPQQDAGAAYIFHFVNEIFSDGFESGDTTSWSKSVP